MDNEKNLPLVHNYQILTRSGSQVTLVSRGLEVLKHQSADTLDDNQAARQWELGCEYLIGNEADRDFERAYYWFCNAAEQGHVEAQFALGVMYAAGNGVKKNDKLAEQWFRKAASQGHALALRNLAGRGL